MASFKCGLAREKGLFAVLTILQTHCAFPQKFAPLDELQNVSLIIFHSNFTSQTTMELVNILRGRIPALSTSGNCFEEIVDVTHSKKPPISALLWNRNDFKVSNVIITVNKS